MKFLIVLAACVSGFSVAPSTSRSTALDAKSKAIPFLDAPPALDGSMVGDKGFDPIGFSAIDWNMAETIVPKMSTSATEGISMLYWMREAEIKHGRICMLAIVGYIAVDLGFHFPGDAYAGLSSLQAHNVMVAKGNMGFMLLCVAVLEFLDGIAIYQAANGSGRAPGDFALDPIGLTESDKKEFLLEAEVTHCRLAMLAFSGLVTQSALYEKGFPYF
ncbi:hypothetical protein CTAYLR_007278 [Chrysophaeum taylorii]|uniref:Uncharacterized protein n=1 Tax=Chrysophaeum taylorii TaxID=2483200 RepID=A0AAD7UJY2_9STRA|nr:hypothetical protein CTAYLR_007278 [Chrysophaeum taylorii]